MNRRSVLPAFRFADTGHESEPGTDRSGLLIATAWLFGSLKIVQDVGREDTVNKFEESASTDWRAKSEIWTWDWRVPCTVH